MNGIKFFCSRLTSCRPSQKWIEGAIAWLNVSDVLLLELLKLDIDFLNPIIRDFRMKKAPVWKMLAMKMMVN